MITNCYNNGIVIGKGLYAGGVLGQPYAKGTIYNSYNTGDIEVLSSVVAYRQANGIGNVGDTGFVKNCYNTGVLTGGGWQRANYVIGTGTTGNDENCYYLDGLEESTHDVDTNAIAFTKETSSEVVTNLNQYIEEHLEDETTNTSTWKKWKVGEDGYPTFE